MKFKEWDKVLYKWNEFIVHSCNNKDYCVVKNGDILFGYPYDVLEKIEEKIAIYVRTQKEYYELMKMYDKKWWKWRNWDNPTNDNRFNTYKEITCVDFEDNFCFDEIWYYKEKYPETLIKDIARARKELWYAVEQKSMFNVIDNIKIDEPYNSLIKSDNVKIDTSCIINSIKDFKEAIDKSIDEDSKTLLYIWNPFYNLNNKPMTILETSVRNSYYNKKKEKEIVELVEFFDKIDDEIDLDDQVCNLLENLEQQIECNNKPAVKNIVSKLKIRKEIYSCPEYYTLRNAQQAFDDYIEEALEE